jgi:hypothetical protein
MSEDRDHGRRGGPALEKAYQFVLWVVPALDKFPRSQRFVLGDRIETTALAVLEGLIEATYSKRVGTVRKPRCVSAAAVFRDRVVNHGLCVAEARMRDNSAFDARMNAR